MAGANCEECMYFEYDETYDENYCSISLDMDEAERFCHGNTGRCPFYRPGDEYTIVRKQN